MGTEMDDGPYKMLVPLFTVNFTLGPVCTYERADSVYKLYRKGCIVIKVYKSEKFKIYNIVCFELPICYLDLE